MTTNMWLFSIPRFSVVNSWASMRMNEEKLTDIAMRKTLTTPCAHTNVQSIPYLLFASRTHTNRMSSHAATLTVQWKHRSVWYCLARIWHLTFANAPRAHRHSHAKKRAKLGFLCSQRKLFNFDLQIFSEVNEIQSKLNHHSKWPELNRWLLRKNSRRRNKLTAKRYVHLPISPQRKKFTFAAVLILFVHSWIAHRRAHCCCECFVPLDVIIRHRNSATAICHRTNYKYIHGRMQRCANWPPWCAMWIPKPDERAPTSILRSFRPINLVPAIVCVKLASRVPANAIPMIRCHWHRRNSTSAITWTLTLRHRIVYRRNRDVPDNIRNNFVAETNNERWTSAQLDQILFCLFHFNQIFISIIFLNKRKMYYDCNRQYRNCIFNEKIFTHTLLCSVCLLAIHLFKFLTPNSNAHCLANRSNGRCFFNTYYIREQKNKNHFESISYYFFISLAYMLHSANIKSCE